MTRAQTQLKKRFKILDEAESTLVSGISKTQTDVYTEIIKILDQLSSLSGELIYDKQSIKLINQLEDKIKRAIKQSDYPERVNDYLQDFDRIREVNVKLQSSLNKIDVSKLNLSSLQKGVQQQTVNNLLGAGLNTNFIQPVKDVIFQHVVSGASVADTEIALRIFIKGDSERLGRFERYVTQMARDSIGQYDGLIQQRILNEFELDCISYEGSLIKDSRPQCRRWVEKFGGVLKRKDLGSEIEWAFNNGSGMIPGTTPDNFLVNRGGYNCRHTSTAIRCT